MNTNEKIKKVDSWNARNKKATYVKIKVDGQDRKMYILDYLKKISLDLPPMVNNGQRVVHYDQLKYWFMKGKSRQESMSFVQNYCDECIKIWNTALEEIKNNCETTPSQDLNKA